MMQLVLIRINKFTVKGGTMKRVVMVFIAAVLMVFCFAATAPAQSPVQLSLFNPVQIVPESGSVEGVSLGLFYTKNNNLTGLNWTFIANKLTGDMKGLQFGLVNMVDGDVLGYQEGFVNLVKGDFTGWQTGGFNINQSLMHGLQTGLFNKTGSLKGIQFAFVNITDTLNGLQIGLVNLNNSGEPYGFLPIVNWSF